MGENQHYSVLCLPNNLLSDVINFSTSYIDQLQGLARSGGKSGKARRFTCRSKFRAIQALRFCPPPNAGEEKNQFVSYSWTSEDNDLWSFLYCMSELQELRLPCSEETLGEALGVSLADHQV